MDIQGKIKIIGELQTFDSGFSKLQIVVTTAEQYPNDLPIDFLKDKTDILQNYNVGDDVKIGINLRGSEYEGKYYASIIGWKIERLQ